MATPHGDHRPVGSDTIHASIAHGNGDADAVLTTFVQETAPNSTELLHRQRAGPRVHAAPPRLLMLGLVVIVVAEDQVPLARAFGQIEHQAVVAPGIGMGDVAGGSELLVHGERSNPLEPSPSTGRHELKLEVPDLASGRRRLESAASLAVRRSEYAGPQPAGGRVMPLANALVVKRGESTMQASLW